MLQTGGVLCGTSRSRLVPWEDRRRGPTALPVLDTRWRCAPGRRPSQCPTDRTAPLGTWFRNSGSREIVFSFYLCGQWGHGLGSHCSPTVVNQQLAGYPLATYQLPIISRLEVRERWGEAPGLLPLIREFNINTLLISSD